jgi:hypothetical protein
LKAVGDQVVSLDMGNSNVKDDDLKSLKQFPHIQKLHLQNITIGDEGVRHLKDLRFLEALNLSGTRISARALDDISHWQNLKKLYVYNTALTEESVGALKQSRPELEVFNTQFDLTDSVYNARLTVPVVKIDSAFFRRSAVLEVKLSRGNVKYYYTLDGSEPDHKANLYTEPFHINQSCELKIKAVMDGWVDSEVAAFPLLRMGIKPSRITLETQPHPKYLGRLDSTLVDGKAGSLDRGDKEYLGFVNRSHAALFQFNHPEKLFQVTISFLEDVENGVLPPDLVEIWGGDDKNNLTKLGEAKGYQSTDQKAASKKIIKVNFQPQLVRFVRLKARNPGILPSWHPDKENTKPAIFIDEVAME